VTRTPNQAQFEAINQTEGPVLIIAGPGSGKTFTLIERIIKLIQEKSVTPESMLVVTFTEKAAREAGYEIKVGKFPFSASGKASAGGVKEGFVKLIFDAKYGEFLGAHMVGANVTEMIAEVVVARKLETTGMEIIKSVHPHPTMSEAIMEAAAQAYGECIHL
jgi:dihydrolipoamide dehydrogenase